VELGKFLALDAKPLVFGEVPVKDIQFDSGHRVKISLQHLRWLIVTTDVD
jgi:hypothetical protein